jgi:AraC family transcriptional regulator of adaptative response/methylated-DNA-[protein]-cysteine methyltransferase
LVSRFFNKQTISKNRILLDIRGTEFQIKVWEALLKIPSGNIVSYQNIAAMVGKPRASRAVGSAIGKNLIAYMIPCHRVIRETGVIGEYRWGSARKSSIIGWESAQLE